MRPMQIAVGLALTLALAANVQAKDTPALVKFEGAIGVDTLTASGGVDVLNVVRGINPGGRAWVLRKFEARVGTNGQVSAQGKGLLFASGELIATRGTVAQVVVTLFCGAANATATAYTSPPGALDLEGNFKLKGALSSDGVNAAVMPATCDNPVMLVRSFNATTGAAGNWFAAGIPRSSSSDDD